MAKKKKPVVEEEEEVYHVEVITKARVNDEYEWEYYVKWGGYDSDANSWEPQNNVKECERLLNSFWEHLGCDNQKYPPGYVASANSKWIEKEKRFFAEEYLKTHKVEMKQREKVGREKKGKKTYPESTTAALGGKGKVKAKRRRTSESDADDSDEQPLRITIPSKKRKAVVSDDSAVSDSPAQPPRKVSKPSAPLAVSKIPASVSSPAIPSAQNKGKARAIARQSGSPSSLFTPSPSRYSSPEISLSDGLPLRGQPTESSSKVATVGSTPIIPPPKPPRKSNILPKTKSLSIPTPSAGPVSALSTKQRLAQGALAPVRPQSTNVKPKSTLPTRTSSSFGDISFKKSKSGISEMRTEEGQNPVTPTTLAQQQPSSPIEETSYAGLFSDELVASPTSFGGPTGHIPLYDDQPMGERVPTPEPAFENVVIAPAQTDAERFLNSIMPDPLAAPLYDGRPTTETNEVPAIPLPPSKPLFLRRIPKKWKWIGEIFVDTAPDRASKLCNATLTDITDDGRTEGAHFNILLGTVDSLRLGRLHDVSDLEMVLPACGTLQQFGKLGPAEEKDTEAIDILVQYMHKRHLITFAPLFLDNASVAMILVFPATAHTLCMRFRVPTELRGPGALIAALFPWAINPARYREIDWHKPPDSLSPIPLIEPTFNDVIQRTRTLRYRPRYHRALRILRFPDIYHEWMSKSNRPYCVWSSGGDGTTSEPGMETVMLHAIMKQCNAKNVGLKTDVRAVFVHVGALHTLHRLPALAERRRKRTDTSFFTYGSHERIPPEYWEVREIYPQGGIVTFTPGALLQHPQEAYELINRIEEHPLWLCYVIPSVIGMVAKTGYDGADPLSLLDRNCFAHECILQLIEKGRLSLLEAPPSGRTPSNHDISRFSSLVKVCDYTVREILAECVNAFAERFSNIPKSGLQSSVEANIWKDMLYIQTQPVFMQNYRRFVVIKGANDTPPQNTEGVEWTTLSEFDFLDDFFKAAEDKTRRQSTTV